MTFPNLPAPLAAALSARGYADPTPVQAAVLDEAARGRDLLVSAQTGSGKTVAFGLAFANELLDEEGRLPFASRSCGAMARPKATVLPDPVWAETMRSRPAASASRTAAWTGVGVA